MNRKLDRKDGYLTNRKLDPENKKDGFWTNRKLDKRKKMGVDDDKFKQDLTLKSIKKMCV